MSYVVVLGQQVKNGLRRYVGEWTRGCLLQPHALMKKEKEEKATQTIQEN